TVRRPIPLPRKFSSMNSSSMNATRPPNSRLKLKTRAMNPTGYSSFRTIHNRPAVSSPIKCRIAASALARAAVALCRASAHHIGPRHYRNCGRSSFVARARVTFILLVLKQRRAEVAFADAGHDGDDHLALVFRSRRDLGGGGHVPAGADAGEDAFFLVQA